MNPPDSDNPLLTRYALDDLSAAERQALDVCIQNQPSLQAEIDEIQHLADSLRAAAPLHDLRLSPSQRRRVLQPPARKPLPQPSRAVAARRHPAGSWAASLLRIAALVAFSFAAFWMGRETRPVSDLPLAAHLPPADPSPAASATPPASLSGPPILIAADLPPSPSQPVASTPPPAPPVLPPAPAAASPSITSPQPSSAPASTIAAAPPKAGPARPAAFGLATTRADTPFVNASRTAADTLPLHPRKLRPSPVSSGNRLDAKPLDPAQPASPSAPARKKPDLFIHSWSAEVAACPWDPKLRLLRVSLQFPADQEAVQLGDPEYPLEITFDPNNVRQFRRLGTRHLPSPELRSAGSQVVWYEFLPNGSPAAAHDAGKHIATVRLPSARFTTQAVGPFDASRLQVLDRGHDWRQARDDFRFETAMLGLGLLLDGGRPGSHLNHHLLLQVAESTRPTDPASPRARFVHSLRQLAEWTGR